MTINSFNIAFAIALIFLAWRGYKRGLLRGLASLVALVLGCVLGSLLVPAFKPRAAEIVQGNLLEFGLPIALCLVCALILQIAATLFLLGHKNISKGERLAGLCLGACYGSLVGLWLVWSLNLLVSTQAIKNNFGAFMSADQKTPIVSFANQAVGRVFSWAMGLYGADEDSSELVNAIASQPHEVLVKMKNISSAPQTKAVFEDPQLRESMLKNDIPEVMASPKFKEFVKQPQVQTLIERLVPEGTTNHELYVAEKLSVVQQNLHRVYDDPEFQQIMNDPEIMQAVQTGNSATLLMNPKFRKLLSLFMNNMGEQAGEKAEATAGEKTVSNNLSDQGRSAGDIVFDSKELADQQNQEATTKETMFMWQDKSGEVHYTDWPSVPEIYRAKAIQIEL